MRPSGKCRLYGLVSLALTLFASCTSSRMMTDRANTISGAEFQKMYAAERNELCHADYLGEKGGYHYLAILDTMAGRGCWTQYRFSVRAPVDQLPEAFPSAPQKPIKSLTESRKPDIGTPVGSHSNADKGGA